MIVCYFGTYRQNYSRNKNMIAALRSVGVEVKECHVPLWHGVEDRVAVTSGGWKNRPSGGEWSKLTGSFIGNIHTSENTTS